MSDYAARVEALEAERLRPDTKPPTLEDLLRELIGALNRLYSTPPDEKVKSTTP